MVSPEKIIKEFLIPTLVSVIIVVLTVVFLIPKLNEVRDVNEQVNQTKVRVDKLEQKLNSLKTLSEPELQKNVDLLTLALPTGEDVFNLISLVKTIGQENNLNLVSYSLSQTDTPTSNTTNTTEALSVDLNGTFNADLDSLQNFIRQIESTLPLTTVENIKVKTMEASGSAQINLYALSLEVKIRSLYSPLPKTLGKVETPLPKITDNDNKLIEQIKKFSTYETQQVPLETVTVGRENPFP